MIARRHDATCDNDAYAFAMQAVTTEPRRSASGSRPDGILRALRFVAGGLAALHLLGFLWVAPQRVPYPFDLEWLEGPMVLQAERSLQGVAQYAAPSATHIANPYPPLYFWLSGQLMRWFGTGFLAPRLVSLVSSLLTLTIVAAWVWRRTRKAIPTLVTGGLFGAGYALSDHWFDIARIDALYVLLVMAAFAVANGGRVRAAVAGLLLALAFLTKQTAAVFAPALVVALWLETGLGVAVVAAVSFTTVALGSLAALHHLSSGWSTHFLFEVPSHYTVDLLRLFTLGPSELMLQLPVVVTVVATWLCWRWRGAGWRRGERTVAVAIVAAVVATALQRGNLGGWWNVHMAAHAFLFLGFGLALADVDAIAAWVAVRSRWPISRWIAGFVVVQLVVLGWNPRRALPTDDQRAARATFIAELAAFDGPVLTPDHPYDAVLAGTEPCYHRNHLEDHVVRCGLAMPEDLVARIRDRYYAVVVTSTGLEPPRLAATYHVRRWVDYGERRPLRMTTGVGAPPRELHTPRPAP